MEEEVGFEPTDPREPTVFKTVVIDLSTTLPCLEHRAGFEPAVLLFCRQLPWTTRPSMHCLAYREGFEPSQADLEAAVLPLTLPIHVWCPWQDSNLHTVDYLSTALARYKLASLTN